MSTHVVYRGRLAAVGEGYTRHRDPRPQPPPKRLDEMGREVPLELGRPIPPGSPESVLPGAGIYSPEDDCAYRIVGAHVPTPAGGFFPLRFLLDRYGVDPEAVYEWVRHGWVDGVVVPPSPVKHYRVRNEAKIARWLREAHPRRKVLIRAPRPR